MDSYKIDPTQEMMALGFTNFFNSFVNGAFVVSAGMSRSTVNYQANAATQGLVFLIRHPYTFQSLKRKPIKLSAWVTAIVMIIAVAAISEIFVYIPSATLGAVIIVSASSLFKSEEWKRFWKLSKRDFIPFIARASRTGDVLPASH